MLRSWSCANFTFLATQKLCVIVLDNIDLYEDERLETAVFAEVNGPGFSGGSVV
jgi:hypothetical protein